MGKKKYILKLFGSFENRYNCEYFKNIYGYFINDDININDKDILYKLSDYFYYIKKKIDLENIEITLKNINNALYLLKHLYSDQDGFIICKRNQKFFKNLLTLNIDIQYSESDYEDEEYDFYNKDFITNNIIEMIKNYDKINNNTFKKYLTEILQETSNLWKERKYILTDFKSFGERLNNKFFKNVYDYFINDNIGIDDANILDNLSDFFYYIKENILIDKKNF